MGTFNTHQTITKRLKELSERLDEDHLNAQELQEFENLSRKLYERAVILHYKAKEENVYNRKDQSAPTPEQPKAEKLDNETDSGAIKFDFTGDDQFDESPSPVPESPDKNPVQQDNPPAGGTFKEGQDPAVSAEDTDEKEENTTEQSKIATSTNDLPGKHQDETKSFYEHFMGLHKSTLSDQLGASKIGSLKGAIGLNDKLQFISELFDGNHEVFNEYLSTLDQLASNKEAHQLLSQIATKYEWDEENSSVEEFVKLISRRYADA